MKPTINFYSEKRGEIKKFLDLYYTTNELLENDLIYKKEF